MKSFSEELLTVKFVNKWISRSQYSWLRFCLCCITPLHQTNLERERNVVELSLTTFSPWWSKLRYTFTYLIQLVSRCPRLNFIRAYKVKTYKTIRNSEPEWMFYFIVKRFGSKLTSFLLLGFSLRNFINVYLPRNGKL